MKNTNILLALSLLSTLISANAFAQDTTLPVTYAEIEFGCNGLNVDTSSLGLNVATESGEIRVSSFNGSNVSLSGKAVVLKTQDGESITLGTLKDTATCTIDDSSEGPVASWNAIDLSQNVSLMLTAGQITTLSITNKAAQKNFNYSW